jgi:arylsulfatase A-like enzyme
MANLVGRGGHGLDDPARSLVSSSGVAMVAFLVSLLACTGGSPEIAVGNAVQPDVILVSIDTLRADHLSSYGHDRKTSPFLDSLAESGTRFDHARSNSPWTLPAHLTMLTGQLPVTHQVTDDHLALDPSVRVLPEAMKEAGYATGASVATLYVSRKFGFDRGFDFFDDHGIQTEKENLKGDVIASDIIGAAVDWIEDLPEGKPFFLFLHFYDVHYHYDPPPPFDTMFDRAPAKSDRRFRNYYAHFKKPLTEKQKAHQLAQYDESIAYVDDQLKGLYELLDKSKRKQRWVVTSDHGEEFGERGSWGHAHSLYAEQLRVPLIVSGEGLVEGKVISEAVGIHDIAKTIASWSGQPMAASDGLDLNPAMEGAPVPKRTFPAETFRFKTRRISLYEDGKRIEWDLRKNRVGLFASDTDKLEVTDLYASDKEGAAKLSARAEEVWGRPWVAAADGTVEVKKGVVLKSGAKRKRTVKAGDSFQVLPYDAITSFTPTGAAEPLGPWRSTSPPSESAPLEYRAEARTAGIELDDATKKMLEQLGYMQGEEEAE